MTPLWLAALWGGGGGVALAVVAALVWHRRVFLAACAAHEQERRADMRAMEQAALELLAEERRLRRDAEQRAWAWRRAFEAEREEQDAGERWKRGRRPAELDDRDRQGH